MTNRRSIRPKTRFKILERDGFTCQYCGAKAPDVVLHIDHVDPVSNGGTNEMGNLVTACQECNSGKQDERGEFFTIEQILDTIEGALRQGVTIKEIREQNHASWVDLVYDTDALTGVIEMSGPMHGEKVH